MPSAVAKSNTIVPISREKEAHPMTPLETLVRRINRNGNINDAQTPRPLLSLEEFFEGNDDYSSIGCNLYPDQPAPSEFYSIFRSIRERPDVADVLVEVNQHEVPEE